MKKLAIVFLLFSITISTAQKTITTKLGEFSTVKVYNGLTVKLQKSSEAKLVVSGSKSEDISIKNSDGVLKIRFNFPNNIAPDEVEITLFYSNVITVLDANEGGKIISDETINQQHLEVKVQEGAHIDLTVNVKHLTTKVTSGGIIYLEGTTENHSVEGNTGGIFNGFDLQAKNTVANAASGAIIEVLTSEILDAKVLLGGSIFYKGNPEVLKTKKVIGGTIKKMY